MVLAIGLLAFAVLGAANVASSLLGSGYLASSSWAVNAAFVLALAMTPMFVTRLLEPSPGVPSRSQLRTVAAAATTSLLDLCSIPAILLLLWVGHTLVGGAVEFLLFREGRYLTLALLLVGILKLCRKPAPISPAEPPPLPDAPPRGRRLLRATCWLWLFACCALLLFDWLQPLELVGTDPRDGSRYFARRLQRDTPKERHGLLVARPLGTTLLAWHREVTVEPSLPVDLTALRFEGDAVFAERRYGTSLRITLR